MRRVWEAQRNAVVVCDDEQYSRLLQGEQINMLGFPVEYVYEFNEEAVSSGLLAKPEWWLYLRKWGSA